MKHFATGLVCALLASAYWIGGNVDKQQHCGAALEAANRVDSLSQKGFDHLDRILAAASGGLGSAAEFDIAGVQAATDDITQENERMEGLGEDLATARAALAEHGTECTRKGLWKPWE